MSLLERMWARFDRPPAFTCDHPGCTRPAKRRDPIYRTWRCDMHVTAVRYQRGRPPRPLP